MIIGSIAYTIGSIIGVILGLGIWIAGMYHILKWVHNKNHKRKTKQQQKLEQEILQKNPQTK